MNKELMKRTHKSARRFKLGTPLEERFKSNFRVTPGCWIWDAGFTAQGYGRIYAAGKLMTAHRLSYEFHHGPIPAGMYVLHACDNRKCVNPEHLSLGTHLDNVKDMLIKGRNYVPPAGEMNHSAKMTDEIVRAIRKDARNYKDAIKHYGIGCTLFYNIKNRKKWAHVPD